MFTKNKYESLFDRYEQSQKLLDNFYSTSLQNQGSPQIQTTYYSFVEKPQYMFSNNSPFQNKTSKKSSKQRQFRKSPSQKDDSVEKAKNQLRQLKETVSVKDQLDQTRIQKLQMKNIQYQVYQSYQLLKQQRLKKFMLEQRECIKQIKVYEGKLEEYDQQVTKQNEVIQKQNATIKELKTKEILKQKNQQQLENTTQELKQKLVKKKLQFKEMKYVL